LRTRGGSDLLVALSRCPDPRDGQGVRHQLMTVLAAAVCAVLAGARSDVAIAEWAHDLPVSVPGPAWVCCSSPPTPPVAHRVRDGLDAMWRHMAARAEAGDITVDADGRVHAAGLKAVPESATLVELRRRCHVRR
jgi:hypothetical protein